MSRPHIARLLANGSVDETFDSGVGPNGTVYDIAVVPDGDLIIRGGFDKVNGLFGSELARLHTYEPRLDPPIREADGQVRIQAHGQPGARFITQVSTNLSHWLSLATNTFISDTFTLTDTPFSDSAVRFYRALLDRQ